MKNSEFIKLVQNQYKWILFFAVVAFLIGAAYYIQFAKRYEAQATIMIPSATQNVQDKGATEAEQYAFALQNSLTASRITNFAFSDEMIKHLNVKFNLLGNYKIDKTNPYSWNMIVKNFQDNVKVERIGEEMVKISYKDIDEVLAAAVVNEIVAKLVVMNKEFVLSSIKQRRDMFAGVVGELNSEVGVQLNQLQEAMSAFGANEHLSERNFNRIDMNFRTAINDISRLTDDLIRTQQFYKWSQIAIENNFQNNILLVNSAFPNKPPLNFFKLICVGICAGAVGASAICTLIYLYHSFRNRITAMFSEVS